MEYSANKQKGRELDFTFKLLQSGIRSKIENLIRNKSAEGPIIVEFDPTTTCNFRCPECISKGLLNKGQFPINKAISLIDEFHNLGVKGIIFIGGGEPLTYQALPQLIIAAKKMGMSIGLTTNGSLIERNLDSISEYVDWTRFSVDAATQETFSRVRPSNIPNSFSKVIKNIELLAKNKQGQIGYCFLLVNHHSQNRGIISNYHELVKAAHIARNIGCDYFEFKPQVDENHYLIPFTEKMKGMLEEQIDELHKLNTDKFSILYPKSIDHLLFSEFAEQPKKYCSCPMLELRTVVTPKGIYPCPYKRGFDKNRISNLSNGFEEFWLSDKRRIGTHKINPKNDCPFYCIRHESNVLLTALSEAYSEGVDILPLLLQTEVLNDVFI